jgi:hypothetical protein
VSAGLATARGCAAGLVTALMAGDAALWDELLVTLPPLAAALEDAGILFHQSAYAVLSQFLQREAGAEDVAHIWEDSRDLIAWQLAVRYDLPAPVLPLVVDWLTTILTSPEDARQPIADPVLHLLVCVMATEELWAPFPQLWPGFLLAREAARAD